MEIINNFLWSIATILLVLFALLVSLLISGVISWALAIVIIWAAVGFGHDITDKFWYLFWPIFAILCLVPRGK